MTASTKPLRAWQLIEAGCVPYQNAWNWQQQLIAQRSAGNEPDTLLLLQHPPTITLGRSAQQEHILCSPETLQQYGVTLIHTDRGGDVTYHAPGQIVGYPILKLSHYYTSVLHYVRSLEEVIIRTIAQYGLEGTRIDGLTGVWVRNSECNGDMVKIAAIGVRLSAGGITSHGFALNVSPDLRGFQHIIPCGIRERGVTSLEQLIGYAPPLSEVSAHLIHAFSDLFHVIIERRIESLEPYVESYHSTPTHEQHKRNAKFAQ